MMQRVAFLSAILAFAACSGSSSRAPSAPSEATSLILMLQDPDDVVEIGDIQRDFAGVELTRIGASSFFRLEVLAGTDPTDPGSTPVGASGNTSLLPALSTGGRLIAIAGLWLLAVAALRPRRSR